MTSKTEHRLDDDWVESFSDWTEGKAGDQWAYGDVYAAAWKNRQAKIDKAISGLRVILKELEAN